MTDQRPRGHRVEARPAALTAQQAVARYGRMADSYDVWGNLFEAKAQRRAQEVASVEDGTRVLEVAVGTGRTFTRLATANSHGFTVGLDASPEMLAQSRTRVDAAGPGGAALLLGDCRRLPFAPESFDLLVSEYLLDLLPLEDMRLTIADFRRVLKQGGRVVLVSMTVGGVLNGIWNRLYGFGPVLLGGCRGVASLPLVEAADFTGARREVVSQWGFRSEIVAAVAG